VRARWGRSIRFSSHKVGPNHNTLSSLYGRVVLKTHCRYVKKVKVFPDCNAMKIYGEVEIQFTLYLHAPAASPSAKEPLMSIG
jgi:hypothetical protein